MFVCTREGPRKTFIQEKDKKLAGVCSCIGKVARDLVILLALLYFSWCATKCLIIVSMIALLSEYHYKLINNDYCWRYYHRNFLEETKNTLKSHFF